LEAAVAGKASYIISGDKHLVKLSEYQGIRILKPRDFVERYLRGK
jgi:predicted nucleic acid-binding protein